MRASLVQQAPNQDAALFAATRRALAASSNGAFRVLQFSVQRDHLHLLVEADSPARLARGVRVARTIPIRPRPPAPPEHAIHRLRHPDREPLRTPREGRNALAYVLNNVRKHLGILGFDPCSSAAWFSGWRKAPAPARGSPPVAGART